MILVALSLSNSVSGLLQLLQSTYLQSMVQLVSMPPLQSQSSTW